MGREDQCEEYEEYSESFLEHSDMGTNAMGWGYLVVSVGFLARTSVKIQCTIDV